MIAEGEIEGGLVRLRPLTDDDVPLLFRWYSDPDVRHWSYLTEDPPGLANLAAHRERYEAIRDDPAQLLWCVETVEGHPIGDLSLQDIQPLQRRADLAVSLGERDFWGKGYGTEAVRLAVTFAFRELDCRRVSLLVDVDNLRAIRAYEKCGFAHEGVLRAHRLRYGKPLDMLAMGVLREERASSCTRR